MKRLMKWVVYTICMLMAVTILCASATSTGSYATGEHPFSGYAEEYYHSLLKKGFPPDYAKDLTELHLLHPSWNFEPLLITAANATYTWDYIIEKETEEPDNNLISGDLKYLLYRHPININQYDAGSYQASVETVEYFMDPRNFLNETDIFQFLDLSASEASSLDAIQAVLAGTFMENATLENGYSYAEYFQKIGTELGISPIYLAVKVRQEQGTGGTSPIISGTCGSLLANYYVNQTQQTEGGKDILPPLLGHSVKELRGFDGYYNFYNVGASGNGIFSIYYNAMERAVKGTESMTEAWGGSPSWNTKWKSIYGGAYMLKNSYIDRYQSTIYLQKFNVDSRAADRNFWGQYMQSINGAMSEARSLFSSFAAIDTMDLPYSFLIPIYRDMPQQACADPAGGTCASLTPATARYDFDIEIITPTHQLTHNQPLHHAMEAIYGTPLSFSGTVSHSYGVAKLEYRLDNGPWITVSENESFLFSISTDFPEDSAHILVIRGTADYNNSVSSKKNNYQFLCGVFYLTAIRPDVTLSVEINDQVTQSTYKTGAVLELPSCDEPGFVGWLTSDGKLYPDSATIQIMDHMTCQATFISFRHLEGAALSTNETAPHLRFSAILDRGFYERLTKLSEGTLELSAIISSPLADYIANATVLTDDTQGEEWVRIDVKTEEIPPSMYKGLHSATFYATITYEDGSKATLPAELNVGERSALQVAQAALADPSCQYDEATRLFLESIVAYQ